MLFSRFFIAALPILGSVLASPVAVEKRDALEVRAHSIVTVIKNFQSNVAKPIAQLNAGNAAKSLTAKQAQTYLTQIKTAIATAQKQTVGAKGKRDVLEARQSGDLNTVGTILAEIITDLVEAVEGLAVDLEGLPLIGALIIDIDGGLNTLLLGVEVILVGVVQILQGLLIGVAGLLASLGTGLLAGLIFGL